MWYTYIYIYIYIYMWAPPFSPPRIRRQAFSASQTCAGRLYYTYIIYNMFGLYYIYIYIYVYVLTYIYIYDIIYIYIYVYVCIYIYIYIILSNLFRQLHMYRSFLFTERAQPG